MVLCKHFLGIGLTSEQIVWTDGAMFPGLKTRVFSTWQNPNLLGGYFDLMLGLMAGMFLLIKHKIVSHCNRSFYSV